MQDGILYCLKLNISIHLRVESRSPVIFNAKFYVSTVNRFPAITSILDEA